MTSEIHVAMLSGGQDSSCMVIKMLEEKMRVDYIVFTDTGLEFKIMYEYLEKLEKYILDRFGKALTRLTKKEKFNEFCFTAFTKGENEGKIRGLPKTVGMGYCTRELKVYPFDEWAKQFRDKKIIKYIGYTYSEKKRAKDKAEDQRYPLIDFKMKEHDVSIFLKKRKIWNPLYKHFTRTGCFLCPKQKEESFFAVWKHYPAEWETMKDYEQRCREINAHNTTLFKGVSLNELEKKFEVMKKQYVFEFEEETEVSCFCAT